MKNWFLVAFAIVFFNLLSPFSSYASDDRPNNKFGMHIAVADDFNDIQRVAELVNSNGGEWGYITLVMREDDRDHGKWQGVFDKLRELKLIPIVRVSTAADGPNWRRPKPEQAKEWADFLDSLNWVVKDRYVTLFNEPNHGQEWGGSVQPRDYGVVAEAFARELRNKNEDFFIMPAGLDVSAPSNRPAHEDAAVFIREMVDEIGVDDFNSLFDGWASHSYPNPAFSASVYKRGRESITTYDWELGLLSQLGVNKDLPVFIKETGWNGDVLSREQIAENFRIAFEEVWIPDDRVQAVTPFILNYQGAPFTKFSWVKEGNAEFNPEYFTTMELVKPEGNPDIFHNGLFNLELPSLLVEESEYVIDVDFKNTGQGIWSAEDGYKIVVEDIEEDYYEASDISDIKPFQEGETQIAVKTDEPYQEKTAEIALYKDDQKVLGIDTWRFEVKPLPRLTVDVKQFIPFSTDIGTYRVKVLDSHDNEVFQKDNVQVNNEGEAFLGKVRNVSYDGVYKVVIEKPYFQREERQVQFREEGNTENFTGLLPLDFSGDGDINAQDVVTVLKQSQFYPVL